MKKLGILAALLAALVLNGLTLTAPAPAAAETVSKTLTSGDADTAIDVTHLRIRNGQSRWRMAVKVDDLTTEGVFTLGWSKDVRRGWKGLEVGLRWRNGTARAYVAVTHWDGSVLTSCDGAEHKWLRAEDRIVVDVPHRCFDRRIPDRMRFAVSSTMRDADGELIYDYGAAHVSRG